MSLASFSNVFFIDDSITDHVHVMLYLSNIAALNVTLYGMLLNVILSPKNKI